MASKLSRATKHARKGLIIFLIFAISTFLFNFIFKITDNEQEGPIGSTGNQANPYLEADQGLGQIPFPTITSLETNPVNNTTYSLQEIDVLPSFPPVVNVYEINKPREKLGNASKGEKVATELELSSSGRIIEENTLLWQSPDTIRSLTYNKLFEKWNFNTDLSKERLDSGTLETLKTNPTTGYYNNIGLSTLSNLNLNNNYFKDSNSLFHFVNYDGTTQFSTAISPRNAKYVYINQYKSILASEIDPEYRPKQNETPSVNYISDIRKLEYHKGSANLLVRGNMETLLPGLVQFEMHELNYGKKGVYKAVDSTNAFLKVQNNEGILYYLKLKGEDIFSAHQKLSIKTYAIETNKTKIIYIEPNEWIESQPWTNYLQPYFLFEGVAILEDGREADFAIILPALAESEYSE